MRQTHHEYRHFTGNTTPGSPTWCPRACSKNNISMINVFTLTNIDTKIIEGKLSKIFTSEVRIKLIALRIDGDPCI